MYQNIRTINEYDLDSGLYYKSISTYEKKSTFSKTVNNLIYNIGIFNPADESQILLFEQNKTREITAFLYEEKFEDNKFEIYGRPDCIKNNVNIKERPLKNKILITTKNKKDMDLWTANKNGSDLKKITTVREDETWHIDVANSKIRVISFNSFFKVKSFVW